MRKTNNNFCTIEEVFSYCTELPKQPKRYNSCSHMWLINKLYIKLGLKSFHSVWASHYIILLNLDAKKMGAFFLPQSDLGCGVLVKWDYVGRKEKYRNTLYFILPYMRYYKLQLVIFYTIFSQVRTILVTKYHLFACDFTYVWIMRILLRLKIHPGQVLTVTKQ